MSVVLPAPLAPIRPRRSPRLMSRSRSLTIGPSRRRSCETSCQLRHQLARALPGADGELHRADALAPRRALLAQALQPRDAAFVARAPRLDALADPGFLLAPRTCRTCAARPPRRRARRPSPARSRSSCPGRSAACPRSSSTMRVATAVEEGAVVGDDDRRRLLAAAAFSSCTMPSMSRWLVGSSSSSSSGCSAKARASAARLRLAAGGGVGRELLVQPEAVQELGEPRLHAASARARRGSPGCARAAAGSRAAWARAAACGSCSTNAMRRPSLFRSSPSSSVAVPAMTPSSEDLPVPLRPMSPMRSPASIANAARSSSGRSP